MPEIMVEAAIRFLAGMPQEERDALLEAEGRAVLPYIASGELKRVWRTWGNHHGDHGHLALWDVDHPDAGLYVRAAYSEFPLFTAGPGKLVSVRVLQVNPNDPGQPAQCDVQLTYDSLRAVLDEYRTADPLAGTGDGSLVEIASGVTIHDHPHSDRPLQIHLMVDGQKVAEIGPPEGDGESVLPGYIDFLAEWQGRPVRHEQWKQLVMEDNDLVHPGYDSAVNSGRVTQPPF